MNAITKLTEYFSKFPGIGSRQSKRFVYFLLTKDRHFLEELSRLIIELKSEIYQCRSCYRFFSNKNNQDTFCDICQNPHTEKELLMVVEKDVDLENIKKSGVYNGRYFVLGGSVPILEENPINRIRIKELVEEMEKQSKDGLLKEIILAISINPEGENTINYIQKTIEPISSRLGLKISILGKGLSTGTELEYSDSETLKNALINRK